MQLYLLLTHLMYSQFRLLILNTHYNRLMNLDSPSTNAVLLPDHPHLLGLNYEDYRGQNNEHQYHELSHRDQQKEYNQHQ